MIRPHRHDQWFVLRLWILQSTGRVGEGAGEVDVTVRAGAGQQTEKARRAKSADAQTAKGARGSREEPDRPPWQEKGIAHPKTPGTWTVKHTYIHTYICVVYINLLHKHMPRAALGLYKLQAASWQFPCYYWFNADNRHFPRKNLKCYAFGIKNWFHWTCRSAQWKWKNHEKKEKMSRVLPWGFLLSRSISIIPAALPFHHRPPISILLLCRTFSGFW